MEISLRALLAAYVPLTSLVGGAVAPRITWNEIPQGAADPNVALFKVATGPGHTFSGADPLKSDMVQVNVRAVTFASAIAVRDAIVARLDGFRGVQGATNFRGIFLRSERQTSEKPTTTLYHTIQIDFEIWSRAAA